VPPTAPSTAWNLTNYQSIIQDYANNLDQRVIDATHLGISASFHDSADSVLKSASANGYGSVFGPEAIDAFTRDVNQRAAASYITRTGKDGIKLSDRVWKANQQWRAATQSVVQSAVIAGQPPVQVARQIEQYLAPGANVPYKAETAKRLRVPKDTSMPAMRVARTEMQNSFHEGTISSHGSMPSYLGIQWHIAPGPGHVADVCDTYAAHGFYEKGTEPLKPHPQCFCTAVPVHKGADEVLGDLEEWLANPSSHPELEDYYNRLKPILDLDLDPIAGGSQTGPLMGGYTKGDKVLIDVKGSQVIATINGQTLSKNVLTMIIDPGQGMASIKVWRAPNKVQPYSGAPTLAQPLQAGPPPPAVLTGIQVGSTVHATVGHHAGKVGEVTAVNTAGGTYHVKWTDGTENNIVSNNLELAPPPVSLLPGDQVKIHSAETPQVDGQIGTVKSINADASVTVSINLQGTQFAFDVPHLATFKLELVPPPVAGMPPPTPSPPEPPIGYLDLVGHPKHGQAVAKFKAASGDIQFTDGSWSYNHDAGDISATPPGAPPPPPPAPPIPTPPQVVHSIGDHVQVNDSSLAAHGKTGVIDQISATQVTVKLDDGSNFYLTPGDANAALIPSSAPTQNPPSTMRAPTSMDINHLSAGDKVKMWNPSSSLHGKELELVADGNSVAANGDMPVYGPDGLIYVPKGNLYDPATPIGTATGARAKATLNDLTVGDPVLVTAIGHPQFDTLVYLGETPAWATTESTLVALYHSAADVISNTNVFYVPKDELAVPPGTYVHADKPLHQLLAGDEAALKFKVAGWDEGSVGVLQENILGKKSGVLVSLTMSDGSLIDVYTDELKTVPKAAAPGAPKHIEDLVVGDKVLIDFPSSPHHGKLVTLSQDFVPGGFMAVDEIPGFTFTSDELKVPPSAAAPPSAGVLAVKGTTAQISAPSDPLHGTQVVINQNKPSAASSTPVEVILTSGPNAGDHEYFTLGELVSSGTPVAVPAVPPPVVAPPATVDVKVKGTKVVTDYQGERNVLGTVTSYNAGKNVVVIKPDIPIVGAKKATFTKNPKYVKAVITPGTAPPPTQTVPTLQQNTPPPPPGINHLKAGDEAIINLPGLSTHGDTVTLHEDLAGKAPNEEITATLLNGPDAGLTTTLFVSDLVAPGTPIAGPVVALPPIVPPTPIHAFTVGDAVLDMDGKPATVVHATAASVELQVHGQVGTQVYDSPALIDQITAQVTQTPNPPPVEPIPVPISPAVTITKTTKGALVVTEYHGQQIQAIVTSFNANKNVVKLKPLVPGPTVPPFFEKSPSKVSLANPPPSAPPGVTVTPPPAPTQPTVAPPAHPPPPTSPSSLPLEPPKPNVSSFTVKHAAVGGGHAKTLYDAPDSSVWMFKPDATAAVAEKAGYTVQSLLGVATPELHVMTVTGQVGSMQQFHAGIKGEVTFASLPSLSAQQRADIQQHQVIDWLISQHDSNQGAMLIGADDHILGVDKGQAFKFLASDRLDWKYAPNPDGVIYKPLFENYIGGQYDLRREAIDAIIGKIEALDDDLFKQAVKPYVDHAVQQGFVGSEDAIYNKLLARKHTIRADFDALYDRADALAGRSSGPSLLGPKTVTAPTPVAPTAPQVTTNQVTPVTQTLADQVVRAGVHGKTVLVGGTDLEGGLVHVYQMKVQGDGTRLVLTTKVRTAAQAKLTNHLEGLPTGPMASPSPSYTPVPPTDPAWSASLKAIKHFNVHMKAGADQTINTSNTGEVIDLAKSIVAGNVGTAQKSQHYADILTKITGTSSITELAAMTPADLKLKVQGLWAGNTALQTATYSEYVPPPVPPPVAAPVPVAPPTPVGKFQARRAEPSYPKRSLVDGDLVTTGALTTSSSDGIVGDYEWYVDDLGPGMRMQYMPHYGTAHRSHMENPYARHGRLDLTIDNWNGDSSAIEQGLAKLRDLGLDASPAVPEDVELLYLIHQAHAMKLEERPDYLAVQASISGSTPISEQIQKYQQYLSTRLGKDITKMPSYNPTAKFHSFYRVAGANGHERLPETGRPYFERVDITSADLNKPSALKDYVLTHDSTAGTETFLAAMLNGNGALSNTEERVRQALFDPRQGISSVDDMYTGGASYFFTRLANSKNTEGHRGHFWFSTDLMLQTDILAYNSDTWGQSDPNAKRQRNSTLEEWRRDQHKGTTNEVVIKNGFPLLDYLEKVFADSQAQRLRYIKMFKDRGIDTIRGKPVEEVVGVR
jgi:hypothetical protein